MNARQPWNDVNVINITFRDRRCIDEPAFRIPPSPHPAPISRHPCTCTSCKRYSRVLTAWTYYVGPPSELSGMVRPFPAQFAIPEGTTDLIKSHGSGPAPIYSRCLFNCPQWKKQRPFFPLPSGRPWFDFNRVRALAVKETDLFAPKRIFCLATARPTGLSIERFASNVHRLAINERIQMIVFSPLVYTHIGAV